ncbi:endo alpha-1,4 polygalactosaminidase [Paramicrobacterium sp. CJ85]|uniref:endo alpha-1,4 polygalactosaminidase n=1 Tax=Paramicrobacterium sp. CJ85 TaxID=3445355 RepID=UPI003F5DDAA7
MRRYSRRRRAGAALVALALAVTLTGACSATASDSGVNARETPTPSRADAPTPPPPGAFDYQLGGAYAPPDDVAIVVRDSTASPLATAYSVCYVNAFQTQPGEQDAWEGLILLDGREPVADPAWPDELLLDTSSAQLRTAIAERLQTPLEHCADAGFDAVEFDNLDSYERSSGALTLEDNAALAAELIERAHGLGLAAAQKNAAELLAAHLPSSGSSASAGPDTAHGGDERRAGLDFDFAIVEECGAFDECDAFMAHYEIVLDIEYDATAFDDACEDGSLPAAAILRDLDLVAGGEPRLRLRTLPGSARDGHVESFGGHPEDPAVLRLHSARRP